MHHDFNQNDITHTDKIIFDLTEYLRENTSKQIFILTDTNCIELCYPKIKNVFPEKQPIFTIVAGEENKTLNTVTEIWDFLFANNADRNSLIINIGGGIVTDVGGFAASTFKRGIAFINIPTSLLAQIDASVGGKTGVNYKGLKNQIGTISLPNKVFVAPDFLKTLKREDFLSGFGEMIKHALIYDEKHYFELINFVKNDFSENKINKIGVLIEKSVNIKIHFVKNDVSEKGIRKILNFGHTFGHAAESYFISKKKPLKHGIAVVYGIICELWLSVKYVNFSKKKFEKISDDLFSIYEKIEIPEIDFPVLFEYMKQDKKNLDHQIQTVLLKDVGIPVIQHVISEEDVVESLRILMNISKEYD